MAAGLFCCLMCSFDGCESEMAVVSAPRQREARCAGYGPFEAEHQMQRGSEDL